MGRDGRGRLGQALAGLVLVALALGGGVACTPSGPPPAAVPQQSTVMAATGVSVLERVRLEMLEAVNRVRRAHGSRALRLDHDLDAAAQAHAEDMARNAFMAHVGSDGSGPDDRLLRAGYRFWAYGENVAQGQATVAQAVSDWMNSPSHRDNMLDPGLDELGVGYAEGPPRGQVPGYYWAIELGRR